MRNNTYADFQLLLEGMADQLDVSIVKDKDNMYSIFEGEMPICKLIYGLPEDSDDECIVLSFFVDTDAAFAISWFQKVISINDAVVLTACYMVTPEGTVVFGDEARDVRDELVEDLILERHYEEMENDALLPNKENVSIDRKKALYDKNEAIRNLKYLKKPEDGEVH